MIFLKWETTANWTNWPKEWTERIRVLGEVGAIGAVGEQLVIYNHDQTGPSLPAFHQKFCYNE